MSFLVFQTGQKIYNGPAFRTLFGSFLTKDPFQPKRVSKTEEGKHQKERKATLTAPFSLYNSCNWSKDKIFSPSFCKETAVVKKNKKRFFFFDKYKNKKRYASDRLIGGL